MNYFISDLHLGHENAIKLCDRPFSSAEQMDKALIENWNDRVKKGDTVYIVGDFVWEKNVDAKKYLSALNGHKILIIGNHDEKYVQSGVYDGHFEEICAYMQTKLDNVWITLCHYPMLEWKLSRKMGGKKLGYHIHGHSHNSTDNKYRALFLLPHALNAGADINGFMPVTFDELAANNERFKLKALTSPVDRAEFLAAKYHLYQSDRSGKPYFNHPQTVAQNVEGEECKCVAYLHDTLEDTDISVELLEQNFSPEVVEAVRTMTKTEGEDYFEYINRVAQNPLAKRVKLADLAHNMDLSRLRIVTDADIARVEKYKIARDILLDD